MYMSVHRGPLIQRGRGIGTVLSRAFKYLVPLVSKGAKAIFSSPVTRELATTAKNEAVKAGVGAISDIIEGKDARPGLKSALKGTRRKSARILRASVTKGGSKTPRKRRIKAGKVPGASKRVKYNPKSLFS